MTIFRASLTAFVPLQPVHKGQDIANSLWLPLRALRRVVVRKSPYQISRLRELWITTNYPTREQLDTIAAEIGLQVLFTCSFSDLIFLPLSSTFQIVNTWFRDQRSNRTKERARLFRNAQVAVSSIEYPKYSSYTGPARHKLNAMMHAHYPMPNGPTIQQSAHRHFTSVPIKMLPPSRFLPKKDTVSSICISPARFHLPSATPLN